MQEIKQLTKIINFTILGVSISLLTACSGGVGGTGSSSGGTGGGSSVLNIQSVATIDSVLNASYTPACSYQYGGTTFLVKNDGSGSGVGLNLGTGQVNQLANLPKISSTNGDVCMVNFGQLTWYNKSNTSVINVFDPDTKTNKTIDLSHTVFSGSDISNTSFDLDVGHNVLYANRTFLDDGYVGFVSFDLTQNPITSFVALDNSSYFRRANPVLFGFWGVGSSYMQMYPTSNNLPAIIVSTQIASGYVAQNVLSITDTNNNPISAFATATDWVNTSQGIAVITGGLQPVIYGCARSTSITMNFTCNNTYTDSELVSHYRIMKLLGSNAHQLYFMGMDLVKGNINIFSLDM